MTRKPKPSSTVFADTEAAGNIAALRPTPERIMEEFPTAVRTDHEDGTYNIHLEDRTSDKRHLRKLDEMFQPSDRAEMNLGQELHARAPKSKLKTARGDVREVWDDHHERIDRKIGRRRVMVRGWRPPGDPRDVG